QLDFLNEGREDYPGTCVGKEARCFISFHTHAFLAVGQLTCCAPGLIHRACPLERPTAKCHGVWDLSVESPDSFAVLWTSGSVRAETSAVPTITETPPHIAAPPQFHPSLRVPYRKPSMNRIPFKGSRTDRGHDRFTLGASRNT